MKPGIVICTRKRSSRIKHKPFQKIDGKPLLVHLIENLAPSEIEICLAYPESDETDYKKLSGVSHYSSDPYCPLKRMQKAAEYYDFDPVIRITHDKMALSPKHIKEALQKFREGSFKYLYSSHLPDGTGFEIIDRKLLEKAALRFRSQDIEHISYAVKYFKPKSLDFDPHCHKTDSRFLVDYEEDLSFMKTLCSHIEGQKTFEKIMEVDLEYPFFSRINQAPRITVYTCAYNAESTLERCMTSVLRQTISHDIQYILVDDCSKDHTPAVISQYPEVEYVRNESNIGLAASSNVALEKAKSKFIMRIDADDFLMFPDALETILKKMPRDLEVLFPNYVDEKEGRISDNRKTHHVGGALFRTKALQHFKFDESLRGYDGLELFERSKKTLNIGYFEEIPTFFYSNTENSMSKTNLIQRHSIKNNIYSRQTPWH